MSDECLFARVSCLDLHLEMGCAVGLLPSLFVCSRLQLFGKHFLGEIVESSHDNDRESIAQLFL